MLGWLAMAAALVQGGCGFRPLYGSGGVSEDVAAQLAQVHIGIIPDRTGQVLRNRLIERFNPQGRPTRARYTLDVAVSEVRQDLGIRRDASATRYNLIVTSTYALTDRERGRELVRGSLRTIVSFDYLSDQYATLTAESGARDRALSEVAEEIRTRVALYFDREGAPS